MQIQKLPEKLRWYAPTKGNKEKKEKKERIREKKREKERKRENKREKERKGEKKREEYVQGQLLSICIQFAKKKTKYIGRIAQNLKK